MTFLDFWWAGWRPFLKNIITPLIMKDTAASSADVAGMFLELLSHNNVIFDTWVYLSGYARHENKRGQLICWPWRDLSSSKKITTAAEHQKRPILCSNWPIKIRYTEVEAVSNTKDSGVGCCLSTCSLMRRENSFSLTHHSEQSANSTHVSVYF